MRSPRAQRTRHAALPLAAASLPPWVGPHGAQQIILRGAPPRGLRLLPPCRRDEAARARAGLADRRRVVGPELQLALHILAGPRVSPAGYCGGGEGGGHACGRSWRGRPTCLPLARTVYATVTSTPLPPPDMLASSTVPSTHAFVRSLRARRTAQWTRAEHMNASALEKREIPRGAGMRTEAHAGT